MPKHQPTIHDHISKDIASILASKWDAIQETCNEDGDTTASISVKLAFEPNGIVAWGIRMSYSKRDKVSVEGTFDPNQPELPHTD